VTSLNCRLYLDF